MKSITDITQNPQRLIESAQQSQEKPNSREVLIINRLWIRLSEIYGAAFVSQYGEMPNQSWKDLLRGISAEQIKMGLEKLGSRESAFAPNATEFRQLCLPDTISPNGANSGAYLEYGTEEHPAYQRPAIEDFGKEARLEKVKTETIGNLKDLFK